MFGLLFFIWWLVGVVGFIYWWTSDYDLAISNLIFSFLVGFAGPFTWIAGYFIKGRPLVIMKARK